MRTAAEIIRTVETAFLEVEKPEHFTNYRHCEECEEHDETLRKYDRQTLKVEHVNNPGWDPLCFCTPHGKAYYMPSLVRFALEAPEGNPLSYWQQLLFHLESGGPNNALISYCNKDQRHAIATFLEHLIQVRATEIERDGSSDDVLRTYEYWAGSA